MDFFEEARAIETMLKTGKITRGELAKSLGITESTISNKLRLLKFSAEEQEKITESGLSERHARALLGLKTGELRKELLERICKEKPTVEVTEALIGIARTKEAPSVIGNAQKLNAVHSFEESVRASVEALNSFQIDAKLSKKYYNKKVYISVCITET